MITHHFLATLAVICNIKSKKEQNSILKSLARDPSFRKCIREIIHNCLARKKDFVDKDLSRYNNIIAKIVNKKSSQRVKVINIAKLAPFLNKVLPHIKEILNQHVI